MSWVEHIIVREKRAFEIPMSTSPWAFTLTMYARISILSREATFHLSTLGYQTQVQELEFPNTDVKQVITFHPQAPQNISKTSSHKKSAERPTPVNAPDSHLTSDSK